MIILGEKFYNMLNHEVATFKIQQVEMIAVQPVDVVEVDGLTNAVVGESTIYCVVIVLEGDMYVATKPLESERLATDIAMKLARACEHRLNSN